VKPNLKNGLNCQNWQMRLETVEYANLSALQAFTGPTRGETGLIDAVEFAFPPVVDERNAWKHGQDWGL
jgi:hypothetical protein